MDDKEKIIDMVEKIENLWILKQILQFIKNMTKEDKRESAEESES